MSCVIFSMLHKWLFFFFLFSVVPSSDVELESELRSDPESELKSNPESDPGSDVESDAVGLGSVLKS